MENWINKMALELSNEVLYDIGSDVMVDKLELAYDDRTIDELYSFSKKFLKKAVYALEPFLTPVLMEEVRRINGEEVHLFFDVKRKLYLITGEMMKEVLEAYTKRRWISCGERLPKDHGRYLVFYGKDTYIFIEEWDGNCFSERNYIGQPKAWMELPEEYKGE